MRRPGLLLLLLAALLPGPAAWSQSDGEREPTPAGANALMDDFFALCWGELAPDALSAAAVARGWRLTGDRTEPSRTGGPAARLLDFEKQVEGQNTGLSVRRVGPVGEGFEACGLVAPGFSGRTMSERMAAKVQLPPNDSDREGPAWTLRARPGGALEPVDPAVGPDPDDRGLNLGVTIRTGYVGVVAVHTPRPRKPGERDTDG